MDSNHRRWKPADLQSAPFGRSGILPISISKFNFSWASCRIRTNDPEITNHVLWPTELKRRVLPFSRFMRPQKRCKGRTFFLFHKIFSLFFLSCRMRFCILRFFEGLLLLEIFILDARRNSGQLSRWRSIWCVCDACRFCMLFVFFIDICFIFEVICL